MEQQTPPFHLFPRPPQRLWMDPGHRVSIRYRHRNAPRCVSRVEIHKLLNCQLLQSGSAIRKPVKPGVIDEACGKQVPRIEINCFAIGPLRLKASSRYRPYSLTRPNHGPWYRQLDVKPH